MKTNLIISCIISVSISLFADSISGSVFYSTDSDVDVVKINTNALVTLDKKIDFGVSLTQGRISGFDSIRSSFLANIKNGDFVITADTGIESHGNEFTTLVETNYNQKNYILGVFAQKDIVDSKIGMQDSITFEAIGINAEVMNDKFGIVGSVIDYDYEDGTAKDLVNAKIYYSFLDGYSCFVSSQHYETSKHSIYFFSPDSYDRYLFGIGMRERIFDGVFSTQIATGTQKVNENKSERSDFFKIGFNKKISNSWQFKSEYIYDKKQPDYAYRQTFVSLVYTF